MDELAKGIGALKEKIASVHDKLLEARAEALPATSAEAVIQKERSGEIASQGQLDTLSSLKSKLEQLEAMIAQSK
jgi:hypothetical protein